MNPVPVGPTGSGLTVHHVSRAGQQNSMGGRMIVAMGGGGGGTVNHNQQLGGPVPVRKSGPPGGKLMRLRCRFRPLHDAYIKNGAISEEDTDVIFVCGDGHHLKAHKVILAASSQFLAKVFEDQAAKTAVVSVPDIKVDIMKLILQLTYRDRVILSMKQIKAVGEFITVFGMSWTQFGYEEYDGEEPMTANPMNPIPMKPVELEPARKIIFVKNSGQQQRVAGFSTGRLSLSQAFKNEGDSEEYHHQQQGERQSRKTKLTPRTGIEGDEMVEQQEQDEDEDPENKMRDWMSKLGGKHSATSSHQQLGAMKKIRLETGDPLKVVKQQEPQGTDNKELVFACSICNARFRTEVAWRWHEDRHVANNMFKCQFCDELTTAPKQCYIHEKEVHGYSGMKITNEGQQQKQQQQQQSPGTAQQQQRNVFVRPHQPSSKIAGPTIASGPGYAAAVSKKIKMGTYKKMQTFHKKKSGGLGLSNKHPKIQIGKSHGSDSLDAKKIKQLHWLYVCQRCENCSDSASKAVVHYNQCYPDGEEEFEQTVVKHRQGFYGKSKCPLCPRSYPQNNGFMIHCGHQHQQYRRLFTNHGAGPGSNQDQLKCVSCKIIFPDPTTFHEHLNDAGKGTFVCEDDAKPDDESPPPPQPVAAPKNPVGRPPNSSRPKLRKSAKRPESPMESKASYKVQFHTPPKSARLASRVQAEASAEAAKAKQLTSIDFPSVDCPVCGEADVPNISLHLVNKHTDLKIDVTRVSSELLRCKHCTITFDICDLLDHKNCHANGESSTSTAATSSNVIDADADNSNDAKSSSSRRSSTTGGGGSAGRPKAVVITDFDSLPLGVGRSPIERIEIEDLHSIQAIRSALKCAVCGLTGTKLGQIAECLRNHGIQRCSLCFNSYFNKADYTFHLKKCHGSSAGNKLKCPLCPKAFSNAGQTSGHMYSTHWLQILKENELATKEENEKASSASQEKSEADNNKEENGIKVKRGEKPQSKANEVDEDDEEDQLKIAEDGDDDDTLEEESKDKVSHGSDESEEDMMQVEGCNDAEMEDDDTESSK